MYLSISEYHYVYNTHFLTVTTTVLSDLGIKSVMYQHRFVLLLLENLFSLWVHARQLFVQMFLVILTNSLDATSLNKMFCVGMSLFYSVFCASLVVCLTVYMYVHPSNRPSACLAICQSYKFSVFLPPLNPSLCLS